MVLDSLRRRITPTRLLYHESVEKVPFSNGGMVDLRPLRIDCGVSFAPLRHGRGLKKGEEYRNRRRKERVTYKSIAFFGTLGRNATPHEISTTGRDEHEIVGGTRSPCAQAMSNDTKTTSPPRDGLNTQNLINNCSCGVTSHCDSAKSRTYDDNNSC